MDRNAQKEQFSYAYVHAVASVAGYSVEFKSRVMDNTGIDLTVEMPAEPGLSIFPRFDAQVKCTSSQKVKNSDFLKFPLPVHNYNRLILTGTLVPTLLIIVLVPEQLDDWIDISEDTTLIRHCGYWISLEGWNSTTNQTSITIEIPRKNVFTPENLTKIMDKIGRREKL